MQKHFGLNDLHLTDEDRIDTVSVYQAIDHLIGWAHCAEEYDDVFVAEGMIELFAWLYCAATDIWRGMDGDMTRDEAIVIAEHCFHDIYLFYSRR